MCPILNCFRDSYFSSEIIDKEILRTVSNTCVYYSSGKVGTVYLKLNTVSLARKRTIPTERPPQVGEVSANFCGQRVSRGQRNGSTRPLIPGFYI
jgi:hypothetical protein